MTTQHPGHGGDRGRTTRRGVLKAGLATGALAGTGAWRFDPGHRGSLPSLKPGSPAAARQEAAGPVPYSVAEKTVPSGALSYSVAVESAVPETDGLVVAVAFGGASPPAVSAVTDSKGNTYIPLRQGSSASPDLAVFAPAANGSFVALSNADTFTITLSGDATGGGCVIAYGIPGQPVVDVSALRDGTGTAPSVAGTPRQAGETALAIFAWANGGGPGTIGGTFTLLAQQHATNGSYLTVAGAASPPVGSPLTASSSLSGSASWHGVLLTFSTPYAGAYLVTNATGAAGGSTYPIPIQAGSPLAPGGLPAVPAGDGAVLVASLAGSSPPAVQSVSDSKGNTWTARQNPASGTGPHLIVYTCPVTSPLTTSDTVTVTFASATTSAPGFVLVGASQRGQVEVSTALVTGNSGQPSVTGTPASGGEVVLSCFAWSSTGGAGSPGAAWTRIGQAQAGAGAYATVDYYGTAQPGAAVTSTPAIVPAGWRAVMISFKPAATLWFTNTLFITQMNTADPGSTSALFGSPHSLGITTDANGSNPPEPGGLPSGFATTPILKYTSYAQFQSDLTAGPGGTSVIPAAYQWLMYDNEFSNDGTGGNSWPTPVNEAHDPWTYMRLFVQLAHANGYQVMLVPARDLATDPASVLPRLAGESLDDWYIRTGIAYTAAAAGAEVVHIQSQADQASPPNQFDAFFAACMAQVEHASGYCRRTAGVSTTNPTGVTAQTMHDSATSVATTTQGYWLNLSNGTVSTAAAFEDMMLPG